ncbi:hypothetical protein LOD99_11778 [Oopsacas minuta]|uniref:Uncharacterized protein n=1 Tax=Oopsacas minuta TaxID=111878 RepID=A0AAV7JKS5_9METZ|nr:hypothetical protein LOD99_11778 [Oopsacas minuta]
MSDLIQITKENLFILPSAFNSDSMNKPNSKLFDSDVIKLSPTISFAEKCAKLRLSIIDKLDNMKTDEIEHFQTMSEWIQMSGTVWDTIINYQDIVKYDDYQEIKCSELLNCIISEIMEKHIYSNRDRFDQAAEKLTQEIQDLKTQVNSNQKLTSVMLKFDETFNIHYERCLADFLKKCEGDRQLKELFRICSEAKSNLLKLLYMVRKEYEDSFKFQVNAAHTEIKLSRA